MTESIHSPGPWLIDQYAAFADPQVGHMIYAEGGDGYNGHLVCKIQHQYADNQTANARLIAAAPDLLEAIKAIKVRISFIGMPGEPMEDGKPVWSSEIKILEDALKKATGK